MDTEIRDTHRSGPGRPRSFDEAEALNAALQLFRERGYEAASLEALTQRMGLSKSSFYGCFGSKRGVLLAALRSYSDNALAVLAGLAVPPPETAVPAMLAALAVPQGGPHGCLLVNCITELAPHDPEIAELGQRHIARIEALLAEIISPLDPAAAADRSRALLALALGTLTLRKAGLPAASIVAALAQSEALLGPGP